MTNHDSPVVPWVHVVSRLVDRHNGVHRPFGGEALYKCPVEHVSYEWGKGGGSINEVLTL